MMRRVALLSLFGGMLACATLSTDHGAEQRWWKGNTHTHTLWSDGDSAPELAARWYRERGYDFLVLSDHNVLSEGERWYPVGEEGHLSEQRLLEIEEDFGAGWIELREREDGVYEMRLKTLAELRERFEVPGRPAKCSARCRRFPSERRRPSIPEVPMVSPKRLPTGSA